MCMDFRDDYDEDGNNIVPCPICLSAHCPSKEGGKCPEEDAYVASFATPLQQLQEEVRKQWQRLYVEGELKIDAVGDGVPFKELDTFMDEATTQAYILGLQRALSLLPEERGYFATKDCMCCTEWIDEDPGFNACRTEAETAITKEIESITP